jgi:hypothetical protein
MSSNVLPITDIAKIFGMSVTCHERTTSSFPTVDPAFDPAIASANNFVELKVIAWSFFVWPWPRLA